MRSEPDGRPRPPAASGGDPDRRDPLLFRLGDAVKGGALLGFRRAVRALPLERAVRLGGALGRAYAALHGPRTGTARTNLALAYPDLDTAARERLLRDVYANLGRVVAETAHLSGLAPETLRTLARIDGLENLQAAREATPGGGAIVLTGHFGSFELFAAIMSAHGVPLSIVHRTANNPHLDRLVTEWRRGAGIEVIRRGSAARAVLRALRRGRVVVLPLDQNANESDGVFVPFFGRPACTRDGPARLAMRTRAAVVPAFMYREGDGARHRIRIGKPLPLEPERADRADQDGAVRRNVVCMTEAIEEAIRLAPAQWIWNHRRWKTTPPGLARLYPRKGDRVLRRLRKRLGLRRRKRKDRERADEAG